MVHHSAERREVGWRASVCTLIGPEGTGNVLRVRVGLLKDEIEVTLHHHSLNPSERVQLGGLSASSSTVLN